MKNDTRNILILVAIIFLIFFLFRTTLKQPKVVEITQVVRPRRRLWSNWFGPDNGFWYFNSRGGGHHGGHHPPSPVPEPPVPEPPVPEPPVPEPPVPEPPVPEPMRNIGNRDLKGSVSRV